MGDITSIVTSGIKKAFGTGGIKLRNLHDEVLERLFEYGKEPTTGVATELLQRNKVALRPGNNAQNVLYVLADVVNGDTITIGADVYEVDIINTDTTRDTVGAIDGTSDPVQVTLTGAPAIAIAAGDLVRIENEILKCVAKFSTTVYSFARARCGTAIATHVTASDVFQSDAAPAANIPVGLVTTLTNAAFSPAFVAEVINAAMATSGERVGAKASTIYGAYTPYSLKLGASVFFVAKDPGVDLTATTETFSSGSNVWSAATFTGGSNSGILRSEMQSRVPTSGEVTDGELAFVFPFTVRQALVQVTITASGIILPFIGTILIGPDESTDVVVPNNVLVIRNSGTLSTAYNSPFATTTTVSVLAYE